ncbi:MAG TPA: ATP-binding protein [Nitrospirales bacterium]|jgi:signal transduction histidine kinase
MKSFRPYTVLAGVVLGALAVGITVRSIWPDQIWVNQPLHSSVEALGGLAAIAMAFVLFASKREHSDGKAQIVAVGFLGMGLLECFHAISPVGDGFVFLRSVASLTGAMAFALTVASHPVSRVGASPGIARIVGAGAVCLGLWSLSFPETVPQMTVAGKFARPAIIINALAATLFIASAIGFLADFRRSGQPLAYFFGYLGLLFGMAEIMFLRSAPWDSGWWYWHVLRVIAYLLVLGYVSRGYALMVSDLRTALEHTRRSARRLAAQYEVTRGLAESSTLQDAGQSILRAIGESLDWEVGIYWGVDEQNTVLRALNAWHASDVEATEFTVDSMQRTFAPGIGLPGRVWAYAAPAWILDVVKEPNFPRALFAARAGLHGAFAFPIRNGDQVYGVIEFFSREIREPDRDLLNMVDDIGLKICQFLQREHAEKVLRQTEAKLIEEAKLAEVARLVADIGHDLKNLLTPIVLGASHVQGELEDCEKMLPHLDPEQARAMLIQSKEILTMIRTGARRIQDRVREIADSVKGLSSPPQFNKCRVADVVADVFETLRLLAEQQGVILRTEELDTLPPIMADESRLFNALYNLVNNAIPEVTRGGSVSVRGRTDSDAKAVILSVADTGRGMSAEVLESLFTYQATSRKHGGTGLGTKIVKDVVDAHGGHLTVESKLGEGTTFSLTLPIEGPGQKLL